MYEDLAHGLGELLTNMQAESQLVQGMAGIVADVAYVRRQLDVIGRARGLIDAYAPPPQALNGHYPPQGGLPRPNGAHQPPPPPSQTPTLDRLREAMSRAGSEPLVEDPDPYRIYTAEPPPGVRR